VPGSLGLSLVSMLISWNGCDQTKELGEIFFVGVVAEAEAQCHMLSPNSLVQRSKWVPGNASPSRAI